ncbi:MAG: SAF domain-containing protein [Clostridia bacterium]|nr:SAF domain-containing protein [Clostridia bacterium]
MIGMGQIRQRTYIGVAIGLVIGAIGIGLTVWWATSTIKTYEEGTNKNYIEKYTKKVAVLNKDVFQGEAITADMIVEKNVNVSTIPTGTVDMSGAIGQVAKYNISANTPITSNMLTSQIMAADVREQEVNTVLMPSDLLESDFVDVRIMYPNGTDYIVLAQKQVDKIVGQTMWIKLTEDERLLLNGAVVDSYLNQGSKVYATKYTDPSSQIKIADSSNETVKGYLNKIITDNAAVFTSGDQTQIASTVFDLIVKYQSFANSVTRTIENYQPNAQVINMMKSNANIIAEATTRLTIDARTVIENANSTYENNNQEKYGNVVSGAQQSITAQQTQRNNILNGIQ